LRRGFCLNPWKCRRCYCVVICCLMFSRCFFSFNPQQRLRHARDLWFMQSTMSCFLKSRGSV
jgi:hypothetical protein